MDVDAAPYMKPATLSSMFWISDGTVKAANKDFLGDTEYTQAGLFIPLVTLNNVHTGTKYWNNWESNLNYLVA